MKPGERFSVVLRVLMIVSAAMTLISVGFLPRFYHRDHSRGWPTTMGVVRAAAVRTAFAKPNMAPWFSPFVCYGYSVDGIGRAGTRIDFGDPVVLGRDEAVAWIERNYPVGKEVTVYYDSADPDLAVLVPGASELVWIGWWCTGTAGTCCAVCLLLLIRRKRRGG
jgi:hypothetical protein